MSEDKNQKQEALESLTGEILFLDLLGKVFITYPLKENQAWYQTLKDQDLFSSTPFAAERFEIQKGLESIQSWIENNRQTSLDETILELQTDNTYLFNCANIILAPPWESVYKTKERLVLQEHTLRVRKFYQKYGLTLCDQHTEPDDHIGLELHFVSYLTYKMVQALAEGDIAEFERYKDAKSTFLTDHLLQWSLLFCSQIDKYAQTGFYKGMGLLLNGISRELAELYDIPLSQLDELVEMV